ncbi:MAG: carboxypeptidase regulatory-like domain-containing protein [Terriglobales bacterium]
MSSQRTAALRFLFLNLLLAFSANAASQTATLSGAVSDSSQAVVVGATISISRESTGLKQTISSSKQGFYFFAFLLPGSYTITAEAPGFGAVSRAGVKLDPAQAARLDFTLAPAAVKENITVQSSASSLQTESSAVGTEIDPQLVQALPLNGRTFQSLIALAPGVVRPGTLNQAHVQTGSFINGQRSNYFTVDGVSANVSGAGGTGFAATVLGTTHNLVSIDDMQEFKLQTSTYSAAYGRAVGGQLEIVTRSGTNQYHGSVFDYFRNEALDANDWFSNFYGQPRPAHRQNDFGGYFGGPILKNRTFFFFSYEGLRLLQPSPFETSVPSLSARAAATGAIQELLNAFPTPNGPEDSATMTAILIGNTSNPVSSDNVSIRIDHAVNQKLTVFGRYSEAPSESISDGFGTLGKTVASFRSATVGATLLFSPKTTSDLRVNYSRAEAGGSDSADKTGGAVPPPDSLLFPAPFASPSTSLFFLNGLGPPFRVGREADNLQRQGNFVSNTASLHGTHEVRFGVDYRYLAPHFGQFDYRQRIAFSGVSGALTGVASRVDIQSFDPVTLGFHDLSLYGQDSWKVSARFTLIYGLRWELNPPPHARGGLQLATLTGFPDLANIQLAPPGTAVYNTTYANFAPRVGAAYQLLQHPGRETVIRGGFGLYYDLGVGNIGNAATSFPHYRAKTTFGVSYPLSSQDAAPPATASLDPPYDGSFAVFGPDHQLPRSYHWNLTLDQRLGTNQVISASYVGEAGRRLLRENVFFDPNPRFNGGPSSPISITTNASSSDYHALQIQFQRRMVRRLAALLSYTWSHSIDDTSSDAGSDNLTNPRVDRGSSDFDARHAFNAAFTYDIPGPAGNRVLRAITGHWSVDSILTARTALPVNVLVDLGETLDSNLLQPRPDRVPGVPLYIHDSTVPGGRRINLAAFSIQPELRQGNLERNLVRGFPLTQFDFDVRRQFSITDRIILQWRADFFNLLNHPNYGLVDGRFGSFGPPFQPNPTFGIAFYSVAQFADVDPLYSVGGPRSIQLSLRLSF